MEQPTPLLPGKYYHIFNRGIAGTNIFVESRNYSLFLDLYAHHVGPVASTFAYCLLRNHFHLFLQLKPVELSPSDPTRAISNFFNAYAKTLNKTYGRTGSLFEHSFRRFEVSSDKYAMRLVHYIHFNPQKHGFVADFREYPYSSYRALVSDKPTRLQRDHVLEWFGGRIAFDAVHQTLSDEKAIWELVSEDDA